MEEVKNIEAEKDERALVKKENKRLVKMLKAAGVSEERISLLAAVVENVAWMKVKLDDARESVKNSKIVITYDNGGNQRGIRENPIYKGYEALWKSYITGMEKILEALPESAKEIREKTEEKAKSVLEIVRERKQAQ